MILTSHQALIILCKDEFFSLPENCFFDTIELNTEHTKKYKSELQKIICSIKICVCPVINDVLTIILFIR